MENQLLHLHLRLLHHQHQQGAQHSTAGTLPVGRTRTWMGSRGSPCMRTMGSTPPLPMGSTRGSKTRHDGLLPVSPANGFTGNSLKADPGAQPPPTVTAGHPVQGDGRQGSHPPGQDESAAKPFRTPQGAQSWSWSSSRPGTSASERNVIKTLKNFVYRDANTDTIKYVDRKKVR
jgi:hypothetical protein